MSDKQTTVKKDDPKVVAKAPAALVEEVLVSLNIGLLNGQSEEDQMLKEKIELLIERLSDRDNA